MQRDRRRFERILTTGFTKHSSRLGTIGDDQPRILQVTISSVAPSAPPVAPPASVPTTPNPKTPDPTVDTDAGAAQPTPPPPLPPGQGTRVDQLV
jgi:hypothetical protein